MTRPAPGPDGLAGRCGSTGRCGRSRRRIKLPRRRDESANQRAPVWVIWGLVGVFGVVEAAAWTSPAAFRPSGRPGPGHHRLGRDDHPRVAGDAAARHAGAAHPQTRSTRTRQTLGEIEQLQTQNAMLESSRARWTSRSPSRRSPRDRAARAMRSRRAGAADRERPGVPDLHRARERGRAARRGRGPKSCSRWTRPCSATSSGRAKPLIIADISTAAADFLDANMLHTSGFGSALIVPLVSKGRAVGTLNLVQRARNAYQPGARRRAFMPIAEIFAVAVRRAAAAGRARQVPDDGGDVGADAVDRRRDQQRAADDHRPLRSARARLSGSEPAARSRDRRPAGAADRRRCSTKMRSAATDRSRKLPKLRHPDEPRGLRRARPRRAASSGLV